MGFILTVILAVLFTEFVGYFLHRLLHSDKIAWLSRSHMIHHLKDYGPKDSMRREEYLSGARERISVVGIGLEWVAPSFLVYGGLVALMSAFGVPWFLQILAVATSIGWALLMFNYFHDAMHLNDFWMLKLPFVGKWFKRVRRRHDIHHKQLSNEGRMDTNFGICFFFMDKLFGTLEKKVKMFNEVGYKQALKRYDRVING